MIRYFQSQPDLMVSPVSPLISQVTHDHTTALPLPLDMTDLLRQALAALLPAGTSLETLLDRIEGRA